MVRGIVLSTQDNVATLVDSGNRGAVVTMKGETATAVTLEEDISYGHKVAIRSIPQGDAILKYGKIIGQATQPIQIGEHVHVHNVEALRARGDRKE